MERLRSLTTLAVAAALTSGCGDDPLAPPDAATPPVEAPRSLRLSSEDGASLRVALLFAGHETVRGLTERGPAERVAAAFAILAGRIEANDRASTERAMAATRLAIGRYRELAQDAAAAADLEAMELTLLRAAALVTEASSHPPTTTNKERQP